MERVQNIVGERGIEIPLPLIEQYGFQPGSPFLIEFGETGIRILPPMSQQEEIGTQALFYLFRKLGDAVRVDVKPLGLEWQVNVYAADEKPLGKLIYSSDGVLIEAKSTPVATMRQKALAGHENP